MLLKKKKYMSIEEFLNNNQSIKDINKKHIYNNIKNLNIIIIFNIICCKCNKVFAQEPNLELIDNAGNTLLSIAQKFGYWVFLLMALVELLKSISNGDTKNILNIISKYLIAFSSFYFLPYLFNLIKPIFK